MTLRTRYKPRRDPVTPSVRSEVLNRDRGCVLARLNVAHVCSTRLELDHVRASHALGMRSPSTVDNLVSLCSVAHRIKTENGREMRPLLVAYLDTFLAEHAPGGEL